MLGILVAQGVALRWDVVDVADDDELFKRYGWSIPVLRAANDAELNWPFDLAALQGYLMQIAERSPSV